MKRFLNFGVSDPLTLAMAHPVKDRLQSLGRARPTTWRTRCLALSAMSVIALASAPITTAESAPKKYGEMGHKITVIPDMTDEKLADLKSKMDKVSSGQADKEIVTEFMMLGINKFVANYDADDEIMNIRFSIPIPNSREVLDTMPDWLERCKSKQYSADVMRTQYSWGAASVQCTVFPMPKRSAAPENK